VSRLEKELGVQLIQRTTRQLRLTEAGVEAFSRCRDLAAAAQATMQVTQRHAGSPQGRVCISAPKAFARHVLHPLLLRFLRQYPEVDVHFVVTDVDVDPIREAVDLVVRITRKPPEGLAMRKLMPVRQILCATPRYLASRPAIVRPADLTGHSCLFLGEEAHDNRWRFRRADALVEVLVGGRYVVNHSALRLDAMLSDLGVCSLPDYVAHESLQSGTAIQVLPDWELQGRYGGDAYVLYPPSRFMGSALRALIDHLAEALAERDDR
jgi:DNA-binding transcriptional LysR family regulator